MIQLEINVTANATVITILSLPTQKWSGQQSDRWWKSVRSM